MKIIITAGGTTERIDDVRAITNVSTGRLGYAIGEAFQNVEAFRNTKEHQSAEVFQNPEAVIYYLHGLRARPLEGEKVKNIPISGVLDLAEKMKELLTKEKIDVVIHAMAVSDYMVKEVTTVEKLRSGDMAKSGDMQGGGSEQKGKISSDIDDLAILLQRAPKVIETIKELSPKTTLVGFKLLSQVSHKELIQVSYSLLKKNNCSFVLANDLAEITGDRHRAYLVHRDGSYDTMENNEEIAKMIVRCVLEEQQ